MIEPLNILHIEDSNADFMIIERHLNQNGLSARSNRVDSLEELKKALARGTWDLVLSDYKVPQLDFLDSLQLIRATCPDLPVIMVTGAMGEEKAVEILKMGAWDFVLKDNLSRLVPAVLCSLKDKSVLEEQRRSAERLKKSEERHRKILHNAMDGFILSNTHGRLMEVNESYCLMSGYSAEELLAMHIADLEDSETADDVAARIRYLSIHGEGRFETRHRRKDGSIFNVEVSAQFSPIDGGRIVAFLRDITERKQAEAELNQKNVEIEQFIDSVSHDLRSPLVTMKTFMAHLETDIAEDNREQLGEDLRFIHSAADKMTLLLDELLELSRLGQIETPAVCVLLSELLADVQDTLAGIIKERGAEIQLPGTDLMLFGDRPRLSQIWQNLIDNAIKFSRTNETPRIELGLEQINGEMLFFVKDNGIGIDPRFRNKIFEIFEKVAPQSPGVGMGLSLTQRTVEKCGGKLWVESEGVDKGSCFFFTLPNALKMAEQFRETCSMGGAAQ